ncbi:hyaluronan mediated motility receptor-like [Frankliniella occidentalis]|uniref:Hyaluronan mediated motility receptor-like n=1 Tax=Frankliniella occidentalis TaxID=133901 RepID=A0A9C6X6P9_FRAOC|nr:hyaluronan mediated motility receptor-like [Frankliniella occidentalis]
MEEILDQKRTFRDLKVIVPKRSDERKILEARGPAKGLPKTEKVDQSKLDKILERVKRSIEQDKEVSEAKKAKLMTPEVDPNLKRKAKASALRKAAARMTQKNLQRKMPQEIVAFPMGQAGPSNQESFPETCVFTKHIQKMVEVKGNLAFPREEPGSLVCFPITCRKMVEDPKPILEEDWFAHHPMTAADYMNLPSTSKIRQKHEKDLDFLPPMTREFLSSDSDTESENETAEKKEESATAKKLIEEMKLTDSESETEEKIQEKSEMDTEVEMLEAEINKIDVDMKTPEEVDMELEEMDNAMRKEEEAIKELERKIEEKRAEKEMICGGLKLDMQWKLVPLTLNIEPSGRQEWMDQIYKERDEVKNTLKWHPNDPRKDARCRKCRQRYHTAKDCPK